MCSLRVLIHSFLLSRLHEIPTISDVYEEIVEEITEEIPEEIAGDILEDPIDSNEDTDDADEDNDPGGDPSWKEDDEEEAEEEEEPETFDAEVKAEFVYEPSSTSDTSVDIVGKFIINDEGERERRYFCHMIGCAKSYARTDKLRIHLRNIHQLKSPAKRVVASEAFSKGDSNSCAFCGKMFSDIRKLDRHLLTHNENPFVCPLCTEERTFKSRNDLQLHRQMSHPTVPIADSERPYICKTCGRSYARYEQLKKHLATHPDADLSEYNSEMAMARFPCKFCNSSYTRMEKLDQHMLTHDDAPFNCDRCDEGFRSRAEQKLHQDQCTVAMEMLPCPSCEKSFTSERLLSLHQDEHEDLEVVCAVCDQTFGTRQLMIQHYRTSHDKRFQCSVCGKQLSRQDKLANHMKQHNGYPCGHCEDVLATRRELRRHEASQHAEAEEPDGRPAPKKQRLPGTRYVCGLCKTSYASTKKLHAHLENDHNVNGYTCDQCGLKFDSKLKLRSHASKHNAKLCGICGVWITNSFGAHMRRHEGIKPFKCPFEGCGKQFLRNCDLTSHKKTHTGEKPFACDICGMRFSRPYKVALHKRVHTGEKPYRCEFGNCTREFAQSFDLTLHMRRHTGDKPHECDRCGERFILMSILKKHQEKCTARKYEGDDGGSAAECEAGI